ncbi:cytochrome c oxidase subunit II [Alteribacter aurantiacus]|uniref:cytochrome c oxidase subunit II n=1 Tax=Alteribacter aurantiacus TaxID=254410 RepID=UPI00041300A5|nr:cytochrome c oxidase subunit II [Alteribacter aurantiacus]
MKNLWRVLPFSFILLFLAGCGKQNLTALDPRGPVAEMQHNLIGLSLLIMVFVIVVVAAIFIYVLVRFREKPGDNHIPEQVEGNKNLEIIWTAIPIVLLIILAIPNVMDTFTLADTEVTDDTVVVNVTAHQYWWEFEYPDLEITTGQDLYIPTDTRIVFNLEASDVIHSFWIPALAGKQDTVPGITNDMWIEAPEEGVYLGKCAELCGEGHWLMDFKVIAVDPDTFDEWAQGMAEPDSELIEPTGEVAAEGREVFEQNCLACHAVGGEGGNPQGGPDLTNFGERENIAGFMDHNDENLEAWIRDPEAEKPGSGVGMPGFDNLEDDEMDSLIDYLNSLKVLDDE